MATHLPFHEQLHYEREHRGWSQADLAEKVGCDTKTVSRWERGESIPRPYHRQVLCELFEKSIEELRLTQEMFPSSLWQITRTDLPLVANRDASSQLPATFPREDWGEAPYVANLYGRAEECAKLEQWMTEGRGRIGVVLGMGGAGKTTIAATVATRVKQSYEFLFWRSLQNVPPFEHFLKQCIGFLSCQKYEDFPKEIDDQISLLLSYLRTQRCLLILDNFEALLQAGRSAGHYREGYAAYGRLLQRIGETQHQSYLLITSREKPKEVAHLEGKSSPVRSFSLSGLRLEAARQMLRDKTLIGSDTHWLTLVERYSGNPLALQLVAESIQEVFAGDISQFLHHETIAFGDINDLLAQQFQRLSTREQEMMYWLAIEREPASLEDLNEDLVYPMSAGMQLEVLDSLLRRSLVEKRTPSHFTLQPVIMEYIATNLIEHADIVFDREVQEVWTRYTFYKAQAKGYVRESQERLLLSPVAQRLFIKWGTEGIGQKVRDLLAKQRQAHTQQSDYLAGNMLNLLIYLCCDLRGFDFSHLVVRQAYLQGAQLPEVNFAHTRFIASTFTSTFGNVLSVTCSPQRQVFAMGTTSGEIRIYDAFTFVLLLICPGHTDGVWSLAFSPDGTVLASSSDDQTIRLWKSDSGSCFRTLQGHTGRVRTIAFSPDGTMLASGSDDHVIRLWDTRTGECMMALSGHASRVWSVAFHHDGNLLASGSTDQTVRIWNLRTQNCFLTLRGHSNWVRSVVFHPWDNLLASGSDDQTLRLWDINSGQCLKIFSGHTNRVWSVAFSPDGDVLASGGEDQTIRLWKSATGDNLRTLSGHTQGVRSISFLPDRSSLVSGSEDSAIRVWDSKTGQCLAALQDHLHRAITVAFASDNFKIASGGQDQTVRVWDRNTGCCLARLEGHTNWVRTVNFSLDGKMLASGSEDQTVRLWDMHTSSCIQVLQGHTSWVRSVAFSPDGKTLASCSDDQMIRLWDTSDGRCMSTLRGHTNRVRAVVFSPNGKMLASGGEDQVICLWDLPTGQNSGRLQGHTGWIRSVAFSPDGKVLASGSEDGTIRLWDVNTWQRLQILEGHTNRVRQVCFSPDGQTLASCSDDGTMKIWDNQKAVCLQTLLNERPYERMNITGVRGLTVAQKASLEALGAIKE